MIRFVAVTVRVLIVTAIVLLLLRTTAFIEYVVARELSSLAGPRSSQPFVVTLAVRLVAAFVGTGLGACVAILLYRRLASRLGFYILLRKWAGWRSLLLANVVFVLLVVPLMRYVPGMVEGAVVWAGRAVGGEVLYSMGRLMAGPSGPFLSGPGHDVFNFAWKWLPEPAAVLPAFHAALAVDCRLIRELGIPGRCRRCDYDLSENRTGVCPECGAKT